MLLDLTKREITVLKKNLHEKLHFDLDHFDIIIKSLQDISNKRKLEKKGPDVNTNELIGSFCDIYKQITGRDYVPNYGVDNKAVRDVYKYLLKKNENFIKYCLWVCKFHSNKISSYGLNILRSFYNEYINYKKMNEL